MICIYNNRNKQTTAGDDTTFVHVSQAGGLRDAHDDRLKVLVQLLRAAKEVPEDLEHLPDASPAVRLQGVVVDEHRYHHPRRRVHRLLDVHRVGDVDLRAAVIEEAGAVAEGEGGIVAANLGNEGHRLFGVADGHELRCGTVRLDPHHRPPTFQPRILSRDRLHGAPVEVVHEGALPGPRVPDDHHQVLATRCLRLVKAAIDAL
eukprot:1194404-Prorocentrum_minimum.AAC.1